MFWVLQEDLFNEAAFQGLLEQLARQDEPFAIARVRSGELFPEPQIPQGPVIALGAIAMGRVAAERGWIPGRFDANLDCQVWKERYGDLMFNPDMAIETLDGAQARHGQFFVRPAVDSKSFTGTLADWEGFKALRQRALDRGLMSGSDRVAFARPKRIFAEYRFFVVDGEVVTGSLYKLGRSVFYSDQIEPGAWQAARQAVATWTPSRAFALDIAQGEDGFKVLEINATSRDHARSQ